MLMSSVRHETKNPQHPYYVSPKQAQRVHFSHVPDLNFKQRFQQALKEGHVHAV